MAISKVVYGATTIVDLTGDTVTADRLLVGETAHGPDGELITGTYDLIPLVPDYYDYNKGYVDSGKWIYQNPTNTFVDIYPVLANHPYFISLGNNVGSRFRVMFTTVDVTQTASNVTGTNIINQNNPAKYAYTAHIPASDGYIIVAKDNVGKTGVKSYCLDRAVFL